MRCTVLGGHGFIGRHLVRYIESQDMDVWVPERDDPRIFAEALGRVFYCIGLTADFRSRPFETIRAHVSVLSDVLERANFDSLLYLSSTRVYGRSSVTSEQSPLPVLSQAPSDLYNLSKLLGESICLSTESQHVRVARVSNVIGPAMGSDNLVARLVHDAQAGSVRLLTNPDSVKDYILVDDVVRLLFRIAHGGMHRMYNVASGKQTLHREWLSALQQATGCTVESDPRSPMQSFPAIDTSRIEKEFGFKPTPIFTAIPQLFDTPTHSMQETENG